MRSETTIIPVGSALPSHKHKCKCSRLKPQQVSDPAQGRNT